MLSFTDETVGVVEFKSSWRKERNYAASATQTKDIETEESACQSVSQDQVSTQTDTDDRVFQLTEDYDPDSLIAFLNRIENTISRALIRNAQSTAFEGYSISSDEDNSQCSLLHTFNCPDTQDQLSVTSVHWNSTGSVIAASYGLYDHEDWCTHKSYISTWNINRVGGPNGAKPSVLLDVSSCVMSVAFHPMEPAFIAAGTFNGDVMVWNLGRESEMLLANSAQQDESHNEPISKVLWVQDPDSKRRSYNLISVSNDGKMLAWKLDKDKGQLKPIGGHLLLAKSMPKSVKIRSSKKNAEMGITSLSINAVDDSIFYIGAESGGLFKCSFTDRSAPIVNDLSEVQMYDPVTLAFLPHQGPAYAVAANPFHRNLFMTCSSDTTLRLYSALQTEPLTVIEPACGYLYGVRWSPSRPLVFAVASQSGQLLIYDLKRTQNAPVYKLEASGTTRSALQCLEFNSKQRNLLAVGDANGSVKVWKLNDDLVRESSSERDILDSIADTSVNE